MNLSKVIPVSNVFDMLTDRFGDYQVDASRIDMMGISDNAFLHHSLDMPYKTAYDAFTNLKNYISFSFRGSSNPRNITPLQFIQGITTVRRPARHVFVFNYGYDDNNEQIFMYDKESGRLELASPESAEELMYWMLLTQKL